MEVQPAAELVYSAEEEQEVKQNRLRSFFGSFIFRRLLRALFTVFLVTTFIFFLVRLLPGDPVEVFINKQMTQYGYSYDDAANQARSLFAIDDSKSLWQQYVEYIWNLLQGNMGQSMVLPGTTVTSIILSRLWWTIFSVGTALIIAFVLGSFIGMLMAYKRGSTFDGVASTLGSILNSVPNYLLALMFIIVFGVQLGWIDYTSMRGSVSSGQPVELSFAFIKDALYHAILPISVYVVTSIGGWMLLMKSSTISTLEEDYVTAGRARGVPEWRILTFYVGRNAILPLFTQLTISIGFVVGGSLLVEPIFQYQGIGMRLYESINQRDYPVLQGIFLVITISVVAALFVADLLYSRLDPRIRS